MIGFTAFSNVFDNKTHRRFSFGDWVSFVAALEKMSYNEGYKPKKGEKTKKGSPLITPAFFKKGQTRKNDSVIGWMGWAALDIDNFSGTFKDAIDLFMNYRFVCYSTASSTEEKPKFRVVLDLDCEVPADKIKHLWYALNKEFNSLGDPQTKDLSRLYYIPAKYPNAYNFFMTNEGNPVDVKALLNKYEYVKPTTSFLSKLPPKMQKAILEHRKAQLTNTNYSWTSYRDCPFVNKKLIEEYRSITDTGWYSKMYGIMVNIASNATKSGYPITANQIGMLCKQIDMETGNWYKHRNFEMEAGRALEWVLANSLGM